MEHTGTIVRRGLSKINASVEYKIWHWKKKTEQTRNFRVTKSEVQSFALEAFKKAGISNFKASHGWYRRWQSRWKERPAESIKTILKAKLEVEGFHEAIPEHTNTKKSKKIISFDRACEQVQKLENIETKVHLATLKEKDKTNKHTIPSELEQQKSKPNLNSDKSVQKLSNNTSVQSCDEVSTCKENKLVPLENFSVFKIDGKSKITNEAALNDSEVFINASHEKNQSPVRIEANIKQMNDSFESDFSQIEDCLVIKSNTLNKVLKNGSKKQVRKTLENDKTALFLCNQRNLKRKEISKNLTKGQVERNVDKIAAASGVPNLNGNTYDSSAVAINKTLALHNHDSSITNPKNMFVQSYLDFGDHERYCDSCKDFHPFVKGSNFGLCNPNDTDNTQESLLSHVLENSCNVIKSDKTFSKQEPVVKQSEHNLEDVDSTLKVNTPSTFFRQGKRYQLQYKTEVINYALSHTMKEATIKFNVNRSTVSEWVAERKRSLKSSPLNPLAHKKEKRLDETEFLSWLESSKFNITRDQIKEKTSGWLHPEKPNHKNCNWIHMYSHRIHGIKGNSINKRYISYPDEFKQVVVFYAETHSQLAAAKVFNVARRRVFSWQETLGKKKKLKEDEITHNVTDSDVDKQVLEWFCDQHPTPSSKQVRNKGVELYRLAGYDSIQCGAQWYYRWRARHKLPPARSERPSDLALLAWVLTQLDSNHIVTHASLAVQAEAFTNTKVSKGWSTRFCKRYHKLLLTLPELTTPLPDAMELQVCEFRKRLQNIVADNGFGAKKIIAMDEVPLHILPQDNSKKPTLIRRPGFESCQASLMISCLSDGTLLPTILVLKSCFSSTAPTSPYIISTVNATGLVTEETMDLWMDHVCLRQFDQEGGVLVTDCFAAHTTDKIQHTLKTNNIHHAVIPGGCAFKLLPIVQACQLFKKMLEEMCSSSLTDQKSIYRPPTADQLYQWAISVHSHLEKHQNENIKAAFHNLLLSSS